MNTLVFVIFGTFVASASAQSFSIGIGLGGGKDAVIPAFDSQRSSVTTTRGNPFSLFGSSGISRSRGESLSHFEDFFSSSRVASLPKKSGTTRSSSRPTSAAQSSSVRFREPTPLPTQRVVPTPNPTITSRGVAVAAPTPARQQTTPSRPSSFNPLRESPRTSAPNRGSPSFDLSGASAFGVVRATPDLSSRGRVQEEVIIPVTRPITTTEAAEVVDVRDNLVGQSVCARGSIGDACRDHLAITAMSCATGFCQECQQCGTMSPDLWPKCCREHFLCCRPLAKACQSCDQPLLTPFCGAAFGRCN